MLYKYMATATKLQLVKPTDTQTQREAICDEFGELKRKEAEFAPTATRLKTVRDIIATWIPKDHPADLGSSFSGNLYTVNVSMRQNERTPSSMTKLLNFLGPKKFLSLCKIGVGALEDLLGKAIAATWLSEDRTGPRNITAVAKARPDTAA
jgi:hypothetical protein